MALAGIAIEALIIARTGIEIVRLHAPDKWLPPAAIGERWGLGIVIAAISLIASFVLYRMRKFEFAVAVAVVCVIAEIVYKYLALG